MTRIINFVNQLRRKARENRAQVFRSAFRLDETTRILDLGSETGANINFVLQGSPVRPENVYIADINQVPIEKGKRAFGYNPVLLDGSGELPFGDGFFDIVYCSSVIEHVTVEKEKAWSLRSGGEFKAAAIARQTAFAREIQRVGKQFFVQTPYKHFPIESHSWLPFVAWLPRWALVGTLRATNLFWVKKTIPDFCLLDKQEMSKLFAGARIVEENVVGLTKSIMAIKAH